MSALHDEGPLISRMQRTSHPANVCRAEVHIFGAIVEGVLEGGGGPYHVAPRRVKHALWLAGRTAGIKQE